MKPGRLGVGAKILAFAASLLFAAQASAQTDPLPSWNDGPAKKAIVEFVQTTTTQGSPKFVPPAERVATFDQDGTLWVEHPMYSQVMYCPRARAGTGQGEARTGQGRAVHDGAGVLKGDRAAIAKLTGAGSVQDRSPPRRPACRWRPSTPKRRSGSQRRRTRAGRGRTRS